MIAQFPHSMHRAVTGRALTYIIPTTLPPHSIPFTEHTIPLLSSNKHSFGITLHFDSSKWFLYSCLIFSACFVSIPVTYHHSEVPGMILMDSTTPSPTPALQVNRKTLSLPRLSLDIEGVEFSCLFYLPQKAEFLFLLQLSTCVKEPSVAVSFALETVHSWILQFSVLYRQVCVENWTDNQLYSVKFTDLAYLDTTLNHVQADLFRDRIAPLMLFFKSKPMFVRLKKQILSAYKVGISGALNRSAMMCCVKTPGLCFPKMKRIPWEWNGLLICSGT